MSEAPLTEVPIEEDPTSYETPHDTDEFKRSFALNYAVRKKPKALFAMAMGFPEFQGILDRPPLSTIKRKELNEHYIPKAEDFKHEIKRRSHFFMNSPEEANFYTDELKRSHPLKTKRSSIVLPQPNQWLNTQLKSWLVEKPLKPNDNDTRFIRFQIKRSLEYLAAENGEGGPEVLRDLPFAPTPVDAPLDGPIGEVADVSAPVTAAIIASPPASHITPAPGEIDTANYIYTSAADSDEYKLSAAETFLLRGSKPRVLFALALGVPELQAMVESATFNLVKRKEVTEDYVPRAEDYRYEIKRRAHCFMNAEDQVMYYVNELKMKNPLENMRGVVSLPQPNQWKLQALKSWLIERPLKPDPKDSDFLKGAIEKCMEALSEAVTKDPTLSQGQLGKRTSSAILTGTDLLGTAMLDAPTNRVSLMEVMAKQDAILGAVSRQAKQQTILNKVTILTQSNMGYQQEVASLRSTLNDIENRIMTVEMKIAESPSAEASLKKIISTQEERKASVDAQIKELEAQILSGKDQIEVLNKELEDMESAAIVEPVAKKLKTDEDEEIVEASV
ncbi:hypothetical protein IV203_033863 [Nitzschia inconspicua]|uniref:Uncharacterized protein n=1 Tax=Nitzschia inconspicua TaxID=303405 RepID=A0A9K3Q9F3_9STRA|nr:hypothetical protein IV203_033863 [Nitzschia inconspicua]